jgi:hypothetical protein
MDNVNNELKVQLVIYFVNLIVCQIIPKILYYAGFILYYIGYYTILIIKMFLNKFNQRQYSLISYVKIGYLIMVLILFILIFYCSSINETLLNVSFDITDKKNYVSSLNNYDPIYYNVINKTLLNVSFNSCSFIN